MKASFQKFKLFLSQHIWAEFLLVFIVHFTIQSIGNYMRVDDKSLSELLFSSASFSIIFVPIFRMTRPTEEGLGLYTMVDHVRHYQIGQKEQIKSFLESQGYSLEKNDGTVSYFKSESDSIFTTQKTFIHETDHWIALVAPADILDIVPLTITSIYPQKKV